MRQVTGIGVRIQFLSGIVELCLFPLEALFWIGDLFALKLYINGCARVHAIAYGCLEELLCG